LIPGSDSQTSNVICDSDNFSLIFNEPFWSCKCSQDSDQRKLFVWLQV
jgi:uncharacterized membrane protein